MIITIMKIEHQKKKKKKKTKGDRKPDYGIPKVATVKLESQK
jgi:hypothetical protein